jgi:hypothetical protein
MTFGIYFYAQPNATEPADLTPSQGADDDTAH